MAKPKVTSPNFNSRFGPQFPKIPSRMLEASGEILLIEFYSSNRESTEYDTKVLLSSQTQVAYSFRHVGVKFIRCQLPRRQGKV